MKNKNKSTILRDSVILCIITLVAGALLGMVYQVTKDPIEARKMAEKQKTYQSAYEDAQSFAEDEKLTKAMTDLQAKWDTEGSAFGKAVLNEVLLAKDASGNTIGYMVASTSKEGYGGAIDMAVGIALDGTVVGVQVLEMSESAGLGDRAKEDSFRSQYVGKAVNEYTVVKTGASKENEIDALSGATITSKAVTNAVNAAVYFISENR